MPSQLTQLVYFSEVNPAQPFDLESILRVAQKENKRQFITGALWMYKKYFIQVLEGERAKVSTLYNKIIQDKRHERVVLVGCVDVEQRDFADWWMAYIMDNKRNQDLILKYACSDVLEPRKMSHKRLLNLMKESQMSQSA